ncbi:hypothetical protein IPL85_04940 [Candidatus Saccharibacteria bacterium]|nr:MAG: hypothetical protein IPL85_04940 [Candidatus Saccharibacteria bacterium]
MKYSNRKHEAPHYLPPKGTMMLPALILLAVCLFLRTRDITDFVIRWITAK